MSKAQAEWQKYQHNLLKALAFLNGGGDPAKASTLLTKAADSLPAAFQVKGHPVNTLLRENQALKQMIAENVLPLLKKWQQDGKNQDLKDSLAFYLRKLYDIDHHYKRMENSLFPLLVKYGLMSDEQTSKLWNNYDQALALIEQAKKAEATSTPDKLYLVEAAVEKACQELEKQIFYENTVLLPTMVCTLSPQEWYEVKQDELEIGYALLKAIPMWKPARTDVQPPKLPAEIVTAFHRYIATISQIKTQIKASDVLKGDQSYPIGDSTNSPALVLPQSQQIGLKLEVGSLNLNEIPAIFNVLPIDLTFVDKNDRVKWFSNSDRVFPRTRSVIGRPVIRCHPPKSIDKVLKILADFHKGYADSEDFWVNVHGRTIYLCFYAVRDNEDHYLGALETVQDITKFKTITGTKTLENL